MIQAGRSREGWVGGVGDLEPELGLQQRQALAGCDPQLPLHQVQPRHSLGDRVLNLQATPSQPRRKACCWGHEAEPGLRESRGLTGLHA